jgi:hypothetical protein
MKIQTDSASSSLEADIQFYLLGIYHYKCESYRKICCTFFRKLLLSHTNTHVLEMRLYDHCMCGFFLIHFFYCFFFVQKRKKSIQKEALPMQYDCFRKALRKRWKCASKFKGLPNLKTWIQMSLITILVANFAVAKGISWIRLINLKQDVSVWNFFSSQNQVQLDHAIQNCSITFLHFKVLRI